MSRAGAIFTLMGEARRKELHRHGWSKTRWANRWWFFRNTLTGSFPSQNPLCVVTGRRGWYIARPWVATPPPAPPAPPSRAAKLSEFIAGPFKTFDQAHACFLVHNGVQ